MSLVRYEQRLFIIVVIAWACLPGLLDTDIGSLVVVGIDEQKL